ncbi:MAG: tannase/feruloyl esterase family alpha/beta hydrolase [Janthinobacterium lividum]
MFRFLPVLSLAVLFAPAAFAATDCASLKSLQLQDATLTAAERVGPGVMPIGAMANSAPMKQMPAFCRLTGILHPTSDSVIRFEVWLPEAANWNSRILNIGNGGFAGSIDYRQMASNLQRGYATAGSDAGHQAEAEDASWAYHHPEKIVDFGYRAVHLTALRSKDVVKAFYGKPQTTAYFDACSDGGREALMEAQRFPEDYDGILAGAPANNWVHMVSAGISLAQATTRNPAAYISSMKLSAINRASLAACDAQDGLKDGIVSNPAACKFDPAVLLCKDADDVSCLTAPQVESLRAFYGGAHDAAGKEIFPGLLPGDENPVWHDWILGNSPSGSNYLTGFFRYMVYSDPTWQALSANPAEALKLATERVGKDIDATDPDLTRFAARGGKLMIYHGWNDPAISPWNTIHYAKEVSATMGADRAASMLRVYLVPGMEHCLNGPGPNVLGQLSLPGADGPGTGALDLLQTWVEKGQAPGIVLAAKIAGTREAPIRTVRPLCPWPQEAKYDGKGDPKVPASFSCVAPQ